MNGFFSRLYVKPMVILGVYMRKPHLKWAHNIFIIPAVLYLLPWFLYHHLIRNEEEYIVFNYYLKEVCSLEEKMNRRESAPFEVQDIEKSDEKVDWEKEGF